MIDITGETIEEGIPEEFAGWKNPEIKLGAWLKSIQKTKEDLMDVDNEPDKDSIVNSYAPYVINHCLMGDPRTAILANEMNKLHNELDKEQQYHFLCDTIEKGFYPFRRWLRPEKIENLEIIQNHYCYSKEKAKQVLDILTDDQVNLLKKQYS